MKESSIGPEGEVRWYEHKYQISGNATFPVDMLRYETSFPATAADAAVLAEALRSENRTARVITLLCITTDRHWRPAADRWRAQGWFVRGHQRVGSYSSAMIPSPPSRGPQD